VVSAGKGSAAQALSAFYEEAQAALAALATAHGVYLPAGHAALESTVLHWRLTVHATPEHQYWAELWFAQATRLGLGIVIEPNDVVIDQEGRIWTLLGLDPSSPAHPVRLMDADGVQHMASIESAQLFQLIKKAAVDADPLVEG
jgi:hypothetical protein